MPWLAKQIRLIKIEDPLISPSTDTLPICTFMKTIVILGWVPSRRIRMLSGLVDPVESHQRQVSFAHQALSDVLDAMIYTTISAQYSTWRRTDLEAAYLRAFVL